MKEVFSYVRPACDFAGVLSHEASVGVVDGRMEAYNKTLVVSQPCDLPNFSVPVVDFDNALRRLEDPTLRVTDQNVILTGNTRVKRLANRTALKRPECETHEISDLANLLDVIDEVFSFTEGNPARPWSEGARFDQTTVTATNSVMLIQSELNADSGLEGVTLSRTALAYIRLRRADLKSWAWTDRGLLMDFTDGAWALAAKMSMEMPEQAVGLLSQIEDWSEMQSITDEYRGSVMRAADWAEELLEIHEDKIHAGKFSTDHDEPAQTNLGDKVPALFSAKDLVTVIGTANHVGFDRYPNPVPFTTKSGSKGLIAGRS